jgi:hypothetical protein
VADYAVSNVTTGPHPMWFRRKELNGRGYLSAADLAERPDCSYVKAAGLAIVKQRPSTAVVLSCLLAGIYDFATFALYSPREDFRWVASDFTVVWASS